MSARRQTLLWVITIVLCVVSLQPAGAIAAESPEQTMLRHINEARADAGLPRVTLHSGLGQVAGSWSASMSERQTLAHNPHLETQVCGNWTRLAENVGVGWNRGEAARGESIARLHQAFMQSPDHRSIVLGDFAQVGIGFAVDDRVWVTVNFVRGGPVRPCVGAASTQPTHPTERISESDPVAAAVAVSRQRFAGAGVQGRQASHAVLSRSDVFADSLAAAPLTDAGPLLFTSSAALGSAARGELSRILAPGATVYLLGGTSALGPQVEQAVRDRGFRPVRLGGSSRVETALRVADVVRDRHPDVAQVAVARAFAAPGNPTSGWADSVAGGAWAAARGVPVLLTPSERLDPAVAAWLARVRPARSVLLGGTAALSSAVEQAVPNAFRVGGADRAATAAAIATRLWRVDTAPERQFVIINGVHAQGWAHGLVAGGVAADDGAPILMVGRDVPASTRQLVADCSGTVTGLTVMGDTTVVTTRVLRDLEQSGTAC
jgi:putative cell wall-binding protein